MLLCLSTSGAFKFSCFKSASAVDRKKNKIIWHKTDEIANWQLKQIDGKMQLNPRPP